MKHKLSKGIQLECNSNPQDVLLPPNLIVDFPPVETRIQELPFDKLTWENFERLCYRLSGKDSEAESWQRYGRQGQAQAGIDIFVRRKDGQYDLWQCKRYTKKFTSKNVKDAVDIFLKGKWKDKANSLILSVTMELNDTALQDSIEEQALRLKKEKITFLVYGNDSLSQEIKPYPDLVDDFFGRTWVKNFCGHEAIANLDEIRQKLDGEKYLQLRKELFIFYKHFFTTLDRGLVSSTNLQSGVSTAPELLDRFIVPDVIVRESFTTYGSTEQFNSNDADTNDYYQNQNTYQQGIRKKSDEVVEQIQRLSIQNWLIDKNTVAILGDAGSGKSTLLRCLALDLLSNQLVFPELSKAWGNFIPIIVPFARWTRAINDNPEGISLEEMICKWLKTFSISETLLSLIKVALQDRRLLLLVDGLDEWNNEIAARTALDQLETFVKTHNVAAILTGRPLGVSKLGGLGQLWRSIELAQLSKTQQYQLADIWFKNSQQQSKNDNTRQVLVNWQIDNFFKDLHDGGQLQDLSGTPLLLTGLISLRVRQVNLPRNRFQVYEELTKLLLELHPQARASAAAAIQQRFEILSDFEIRRRVLGKLAYEIRIIGADNGFSKPEAESILIKFLKDDDVLGLSAERARKGAQEILAVNSETSGILIEKSPGEIGFIHAVFEEYLTATHLSGFTLDQQLILVSEKCSDPRWRNVILSLFHQLNRTNEIDELIVAIENADVGIIGDFYRRQLLAETAFGNNRCTLRVAKRIAQEVLNKIDFGYWMPERRSLMKYALMDGTAGNLKELQNEKLKCWYPDTQSSRARLFDALSFWEKNFELLEVLWRGLFDVDRSNRRSAAKALAKVYEGDEVVKQRLFIAIKEPYEPEITATLLFTLAKGWPEIDEIKKLIDIARASESYDLQLVGVLAAVDLGIHTERDRDILLKLSHRSNKNHYFKDELINAYIKGWCNDPVIFEACWKAWPHHYSREDAIDNDIAQSVLLLGYASDKRVIEYLCNLLTSDNDRPFLSNEPWDAISKSFTKHPLVSDAIDKHIARLEQGSFHGREIALAAQISRSPQAKIALLNLLDSKNDSFPHWPVWGLLEAWGMEDNEVSESLRNRINTNDLTYLGNIAHHLPDIIKDKTVCKQILLEIAQQENITRPDFLVTGFVSLGIDHTDHEVLDLLLDLAKKNVPHNGLHSELTFALISYFPLDSRVREFASKIVNMQEGFLSVIADRYSNDIEIRTAVLNRATPLPSILRKDIVLLAERKCDESIEFNQVLLQYNNENDTSVRTVAESAYFSTLKRRGKLDENIDKILTEELLSIGYNFDRLRQSAFSGVICAGRLSLFKDLKERGGENPLTISVLEDSYRQNTDLIEITAAHWDEISAELGTEAVSRLTGWGRGGDISKWDALAPFLDSSSTLKADFIEYCKNTENFLTSTGLQALAKLRVDQFLLRDHCIRIIGYKGSRSSQQYPLETMLANQVAGKILGTIFSEDIELEAFLSSSLSLNSDGAIIALSLAFPTNQELNQIYQRLVDSKPSNLSWVTALYLVSACGDHSFFEEIVIKRLCLTNLGPWGFHLNCVDPIVHRLTRDKEIYKKLFNQLNIKPTSSHTLASIPRLLALSSSGDKDLYDWCKMEVETQTSNNGLPDNGYDLIAGRVRPILHSLFDVLMPYSL